MNYGWICAKCGYSWAIWVVGCSNCNLSKTITQGSTTITHICPNPESTGTCGCGNSYKHYEL